MILAQGPPPIQIQGDACPGLSLILAHLDIILPAIVRLGASLIMVLILHLILSTIPNYKL